MTLPSLYPVVDAELLAKRGISLASFAEELRAAGVCLIQYRDKVGTAQDVLRGAAVLRRVFAKPTSQSRDVGHPLLIMNDRADLAVLAGFDGVHVGQGDLLPEDARVVVGAGVEFTSHPSQDRDGCGTVTVVGVSTHTEEQVRVAELSGADYVAVGPVFATGTKADAEAVVGLEGVRRARALTTKPLVAIGGITRANARSVIEAGADSVAVISGLFGVGETVETVARGFLEILG